MSPAIKQIFEEALRLSEGERAELAAKLIDSLDEADDEDAQAAWESEIRRRIADLDSGRTTPIPWSEARRMILGIADGPAPN